MEKQDMIPASLFCSHHNIELSFVSSLNDAGLVEMTIIEEQLYVPAEELPTLECCIHLYEMDINLEGIETIRHLLNRLTDMQEKMLELKNRLALYE